MAKLRPFYNTAPRDMWSHWPRANIFARRAMFERLERELQCQCGSGLPVLRKAKVGETWVGFCRKCKP